MSERGYKKVDRSSKEVRKTTNLSGFSRWIRCKKKDEEMTVSKGTTATGSQSSRGENDGNTPTRPRVSVGKRAFPMPLSAIERKYPTCTIPSVERDKFRATTSIPLGFYAKDLPILKQASTPSNISLRSFETIYSSRPSEENQGSIMAAFENPNPPKTSKSRAKRVSDLIKTAELPLSPRANPSWYRQHDEKKSNNTHSDPTEYRIEIKRPNQVTPCTLPSPLDLFADCSDFLNFSDEDDFEQTTSRYSRSPSFGKSLPLTKFTRLNKNVSIGDPPSFTLPTPPRKAPGNTQQNMNGASTANFDNNIRTPSKQVRRRLERSTTKPATPLRKRKTSYPATSHSATKIQIPTPATRTFKLADGRLHTPTELSRAVLESRKRRTMRETPLVERCHNPERVRMWNDARGSQ